MNGPATLRSSGAGRLCSAPDQAEGPVLEEWCGRAFFCRMAPVLAAPRLLGTVNLISSLVVRAGHPVAIRKLKLPQRFDTVKPQVESMDPNSSRFLFGMSLGIRHTLGS